MSNWKNIAVVVLIPIILVCLLLFVRGVSDKSDPNAGLTGKVEKVIGDWTVRKVLPNNRIVTLVIGEADDDDDALDLSSGRPADLSFANKVRAMFGMKRKLRAVNRTSPFGKAFVGTAVGGLEWAEA